MKSAVGQERSKISDHPGWSSALILSMALYSAGIMCKITCPSGRIFSFNWLCVRCGGSSWNPVVCGISHARNCTFNF